MSKTLVLKKIQKQATYVFLMLLWAIGVVHASDNATSADIVIFSYHRPLQLYALLESMQKYIVAGRGQTQVIYRADTDSYRHAYELVRIAFPSISFIAQGGEPSADFKPLTVRAVFESPSEYVLFAVDDIIVTGTVDIAECIDALEATGAYGFYLRLGTNLTHCYTINCAQPLPPLQRVTNRILGWQFSQGQADWGYPNTVDMTIYRKQDIEAAFKNLSYTGPNWLEGIWAGQSRNMPVSMGLCYMTSKMVNIPQNRVQNVFNNRHMAGHTADQLLDIFLSGKKIAIDDFAQMRNRSAHMEYEFRLVTR